MQSGIAASQELVSEFNNLLSDNSAFALVVTISNEALTPVTTVRASSSSFSDNLAGLTPHIKPNEPLYIILRRFDSAPFFSAVTYVPDAAKVRSKMLFASTRLTLTRELGSEHFRESLFFTLPDELTASGFDRLDRHAALDAPLTEEERTLGEVKRAEAEAGAGTGVREIHLSKNMSMPITPDAFEKLKELGSGGGEGIVMMKINRETETVELAPSSGKPTTVSDLVSAISKTEPRFTFWRYTHTHEGAESSPVLFFYTCPAAAGKEIKYRMMYPLMKRAVITAAEKEAGVAVEKKFEVEEPDEITEEGVLADLHPKVEVKTAFRRPKRPGR
ncbi:cofilin/tropomyosin-type actin-binding protein [Microdochium bolleyi]|uniref:Twinfilin n=1 Tax=Microdochium bolleyi TaxID=196109 RepID=A0A136IVV8_9PEZI|nr:cofilin/tropomyosin-type actin-binding protein [Microdochium bolleyi]